jgi:hypothetical protein
MPPAQGQFLLLGKVDSWADRDRISQRSKNGIGVPQCDQNMAIYRPYNFATIALHKK